MEYQTLGDLIKVGCGGVYTVADTLGISPRAIYNWIDKNALPRTEYTEETDYSKTLAVMSNSDAESIKSKFKPVPQDTIEPA